MDFSKLFVGGSIVALILPLIFLVIGLVVFFIILKKVISVINSVKSVTDSVMPIYQDIKKADKTVMMTPKSLDGTEPVWIPAIKKDFPEFNVDLSKSYISNFMKEYLGALCSGSVTSLKNDCTSQFYDQLVSTISTNKKNCEQILVHRVVISNYKKDGDEAVITYQAAVQYKKPNSDIMVQSKYYIKYSYFLDIGNKGEFQSLRCPHCGAPVSSLGIKVCPACDSLIQFAIARTWKITDVKEMF